MVSQSGDDRVAKATRSPLIIIFLTVALDLIGFGMVVPLLPLYAQSHGANGTQVALLFASYSMMQFVFAPLWGRLSDRVGRRPVLLVSILGNALALVAYGFAPSYAWLLAARMGAGMCAANISVANAYVADVTTPENRAKGMGLVGAAFGIGFVVGPFLGGELSQFGLAVPAWVAAGLSLCNGLGAVGWLPESLPPERRRKPGGVSVWRERLGVWGASPNTRAILALVFMQVLGFSMLELALVLFAKVRLGFDARHSGRIFAFVGVVMVVVQGGLISRLARRFGERALVLAGLFILSVAFAAIPFTPTNAWLVLCAIMIGVGVGQGLVTPSLSSLLSRATPATQQGAALGLSQSLSSLARVVGPQLAGVVYDWGSENWPFWLGAGVLSVACFFAIARLQPHRAAL